VVVELDVRHHRHVDVQREHRAVRLVGLDHEPLPRAPVGVESRGRERPADEVGGLEAAAQEHVRRHRRRRGLAVCAGDGDRALERTELRQQLGAREVGQPPLARGGALGVLERDGGRVHDLDAVAGGDVRGGVADVDLDPERGQRPQSAGVGAIGARDGGAELGRHARVAAHPGPAETDQVQPPPGPGSLVRHGRER